MRRIDHELLAQKFSSTGLSYERLARESEISRSTIYNVMFGVTKPSHHVAAALVVALLLTPEEAFKIFFPDIPFEKEFT